MLIKNDYLTRVMGLARTGNLADMLEECLVLHARINDIEAKLGRRDDPKHVTKVLTRCLNDVFIGDDPSKSPASWTQRTAASQRVTVAYIIEELVKEMVIPPSAKLSTAEARTS